MVAFSHLLCSDTAWALIDLLAQRIYYVPNTFTPDGDAYNQIFKPEFTAGFDRQNYTLLIFNRWGQVIFESNDAQVGWDGTYAGEIVQEGTYAWEIRFTTTNNTSDNQVIQGHVTLIR